MNSLFTPDYSTKSRHPHYNRSDSSRTMKYISTIYCLSLAFMSLSASGEEFDCLIEPHMTVKVGSPVLGIVESVPVERGDLVDKDQLVTQLDAKIEKAAVELAKVRVGFFQKKLNRLLSLKESSMVSAESVDEAMMELNISSIELQQRNLLLRQKSIKSPVSGVVVQRLLSPGEYAYEQTPLMEIAQIDPLNVEVLLPAEYYGKINNNDVVTVKPELPIGGEYNATITIVDQVIDAASSTFGVRLTLPNPNLDIPAGIKCSMVLNKN